MAQEVMALVAKLDNISSIPGTRKPGASQGTMLCGRNSWPSSPAVEKEDQRDKTSGSKRHPFWFVFGCAYLSHGSPQHPLLRSSSCCTGDPGAVVLVCEPSALSLGLNQQGTCPRWEGRADWCEHLDHKDLSSPGQCGDLSWKPGSWKPRFAYWGLQRPGVHTRTWHTVDNL